MYNQPDQWHLLCDKLATVVAEYLVAQVEAGVQAVLLFDSWVGALSSDDYREFLLPHSQKILKTIDQIQISDILPKKFYDINF